MLSYSQQLLLNNSPSVKEFCYGNSSSEKLICADLLSKIMAVGMNESSGSIWIVRLSSIDQTVIFHDHCHSPDAQPDRIEIDGLSDYMITSCTFIDISEHCDLIVLVVKTALEKYKTGEYMYNISETDAYDIVNRIVDELE